MKSNVKGRFRGKVAEEKLTLNKFFCALIFIFKIFFLICTTNRASRMFLNRQ